MPVTVTAFLADFNLLTETAVNQIMADFAAVLGSFPAFCNINIGGTGNHDLTGQGLLDADACAAYGHTVTANGWPV